MFGNNAFAKVWEVKETSTQNGGTRKTMRISTSRKKEDGTYEQDFSGFVQLYKDAKTKAVKDGDRIQLINVAVTNSYDKEKKITYTNFLCFDFKTQDEIDRDNAARGNGGDNATPPATNTPSTSTPAPADVDPAVPDDFGGFMNIPDGIDEDLPFN